MIGKKRISANSSGSAFRARRSRPLAPLTLAAGLAAGIAGLCLGPGSSSVRASLATAVDSGPAQVIVKFREAGPLGGAERLAAGEPLGLPAVPGIRRTRWLHPDREGLLAAAAPVLDAGARGQARPEAAAAAGLLRTAVYEAEGPAAARSALQRLRARPDVEWAELDGPVYALGAVFPNDPRFGQQWGLHNSGQAGGTADVDIDAPQAWSVTTGAASVIIAILDTGLDLGHQEFAGRIVLVPDSNLVNGGSVPQDDAGHGTHVAGVAAARGNNGTGVTGVCWDCRVMPIKVLDSLGTGTFSRIAAGIALAAQNGARVINLSLGSSSRSQAIQDAVTAAGAMGAVVVAAAGNAGSSTRVFPAANDGVVAIAAIDRNGRLADFSSFGDWVGLTAPGVDVWSTLPGNAYASWEGTSSAAPFVSGLLGLLASVRPDWNGHLLAEVLRRSARPLGIEGTGAGLPRARSALEAVPFAEISIAEITIDDSAGDGDGEADPGETVSLLVTLYNAYGPLPAAQGKLSTVSSEVSITDEASSFGPIASGARVTNAADPFRFSVPQASKGGVKVAFTLELSAPGYSDSFLLEVELGGGTALPQYISSDLTLEAGRTYEIVGNTLVDDTATLMIEPGVKLLFRVPAQGAPYSLEVRGGIDAQGTEADPILVDAMPTHMPWMEEILSGTLSGAGEETLAVGDMDGDGAEDIVFRTRVVDSLGDGKTRQQVLLLRWNGTSWRRDSFVSPKREPGSFDSRLMIGDVDNDGQDDILMPDGEVIRVLRLIDGRLEHEEIEVGNFPFAIAVGDADNDLQNELVVCIGQSLVFFRWNGNQWIRDDLDNVLVSDSDPVSMTIGDVDGDGDNEILINRVEDADGARPIVLKWNGTSWIRQSVALEAFCKKVMIADADNDGRNDILCLGDPSDFHVHVYRRTDQDWNLQSLAVEHGVYDFAVGDIDGDGDNDIVVVGPTNVLGPEGGVTALLWTGNGWESEVPKEDASYSSVGIGDFDGDGIGNIAAMDWNFGTPSPRVLSRVGTMPKALPGDGGTITVTGSSIRPRNFRHVAIRHTSGLLIRSGATVTLEHLALEKISGSGLHVDGSSSATIRDSRFVANQGNGVTVLGTGTIENVTAESNLGGGIIAGTVDIEGAAARSNGSTGIEARSCVACTSERNAAAGIVADTVLGCIVRENAGAGITQATSVDQCAVHFNGGHGIVGLGGAVLDSVVAHNLRTGITGPTSIVRTLVFGNREDGVSGDPAISQSTVASNEGHGVVFTEAGSISGSNLDNCAPAEVCFKAADPGSLPSSFTVSNDAPVGIDAKSNYWGLATTAQMNALDQDGNKSNNENANVTAIRDLYDDPINLRRVVYDDWLETPVTEAPGYLQRVELDPSSPVSAEPVTLKLLFSRSMSTSSTPAITFGRRSPYRELSFSEPAWSQTSFPNDTLSVRYEVQTATPDGTHTVRISGARDGAGRVLPDDTSFRFVIDTPVGIVRGLAVGQVILANRTQAVDTPERSGARAVASWQPLRENDLGGYTLLWGTSPGQLGSSLEAGLSSSATVSGLAFDTTYYFAVRARDGSGNPGPLSELVRLDTAPGTDPPASVPVWPGRGAAWLLLALLGAASVARLWKPGARPRA
jgi:subtilisin family serine protease